MATETIEGYFSLPAAADLSGSQYCAAVFTSAKKVALPAAGAAIDGILKNEPKSGEDARVEFWNGIHKAKAAAPITAGADLAVTNTGAFTPAVTPGQNIVAKAIDAASGAGVIFRVKPGWRGVVPTP